MRWIEMVCANWKCRKVVRRNESQVRSLIAKHERLGLRDEYYCSGRCWQTARRDRRAGLISAVALALMLPVVAYALVIPMEVVAPTTNDDCSPFGCFDSDETAVQLNRSARLKLALAGGTTVPGDCRSALSDLDLIVIKGQACGQTDTSLLALLPARSREGDTLRFEAVAPDWWSKRTYWAWATAVDTNGIPSLCAAWFTGVAP